MIKKNDKSDLNHKHFNICTKGLDRNLVFQIKMKLRKKRNAIKIEIHYFLYISRKQDPFDAYFLDVTIYIFFNVVRSITLQHI